MTEAEIQYIEFWVTKITDGECRQEAIKRFKRCQLLEVLKPGSQRWAPASKEVTIAAYSGLFEGDALSLALGKARLTDGTKVRFQR